MIGGGDRLTHHTNIFERNSEVFRLGHSRGRKAEKANGLSHVRLALRAKAPAI